MLIAAHSQLQRHRRKVLWGAAILAVATASLTARTALASDHAHGGMDGGVEGVAAVCITGAACVAVIGVGAFTVRRLPQRPLWRLSAPLAPTSAFVPLGVGFLVRAGPTPLLQVFRL